MSASIIRRVSLSVLAAILVLTANVSPAAAQAPANESLFKSFTFRAMGPYRAGSWVTSFAVPDSPARDHLYTLYVGTRNGGVWKTTNNGVTFEPIFDAQPKLSIGAVAVAPSDPKVIWVGTGEAYCARSSNSGDGIYRSTDAGKTWTNMGLRDSHHIARLAVHPRDPSVVYVAAMGHLFTNNAERGVFKTSDGGKTWNKVLYVNDKIGAVDIVMVKSAPDTLYAAMYDKVRVPWHYELGGPESAIYKTTDGGRNWTRLGGGLPTGRIGRIGIDVLQKSPNTLYAVVENGNRRPPTQQEIDLAKRRGAEPGPQTMGNEVYRTDDGGRSWRKVNTGYEAALNKAPYSFNELKVDPNHADTVYITGQSLASTTDGGKTWKGLSWPSDGVMPKAFGDWRCMWIDPQDSNRLIFGSDGGVNVSYDRGRTSIHLANLPLTEYYAVGVDMEDPYNIYGGLQDHDSWKGPSNGWAGEISSSDWVTVGGGDGMFNQVDPTDSRWLYNGREMGTFWRLDQKTGVQTAIRPARPQGAPGLRFNWTPPLALSPHNSAIVYVGAQVVFRSYDRGDHWQEISPDLTTNDEPKLHGEGFISYCTLTTLAESPARAGVIWAGADDGKVQVTKDGGANWLDRTAALASAGAPANYWTTRVFPSPHDAGTCFVAKTGWRLDEFKPVLYKTADFGETWAPIMGNLPADKPVNVVVQDRKNANLLFAGTEQGVYVTIDGGKSWAAFKQNMPWVKVTDLVIHPRENDLVVGTYGRGLYVTDISPLQEMTSESLAQDVYLFDVEPRTQRVYGGIGNYQLLGDTPLFTPNEPNAAAIKYYLKDKPAGTVKVTIADPFGKVYRELTGKPEAGIGVVLWDMRAPRPQGQAAGQRGGAGFGGGGGAWAEPGEYVVTLEANGKKLVKKAVIRGRQGWTVGAVPVVIK